MPSPVSFATFIAHAVPRTSYSTFKALAGPRTYFQPLAGQNAAVTTNGLDVFLADGELVPGKPYAALYAFFAGTLRWQASSASAPGHRLLLERDLTDAGEIRKLKMIEGPPGLAVYENVDAYWVKHALFWLLRGAYLNTPPSHPSMDDVQLEFLDATGKKITQSVRKWLTARYAGAQPAAQWQDDDPIAKLARRFVGEANDAPELNELRMKPGDQFGVAGSYLASDPLPSTSADWIRSAGDATRARRLTFQLFDQGGQPIDPRHYLAFFMRHVRDEPNVQNRAVDSVTDIIVTDAAGTRTLSHPLLDIFRPPVANPPRPAIDAGPIPPARGTQPRAGSTPWTPFPLSRLGRHDPANPARLLDLGDVHGFPPEKAKPDSVNTWNLDTSCRFTATRPKASAPAGTRELVPNLAANSTFKARIRDLWQTSWTRTDGSTRPDGTSWTVGDAIGLIAEELQLPGEVVLGIIGAEAAPAGSGAAWLQWNKKSIRFEPLKVWSGAYAATAALTPSLTLLHDKCFGTPIEIKSVTPNVNGTDDTGTSAIVVELQDAGGWKDGFLTAIGTAVLVDDTSRLAIRTNTAAAPPTAGAAKQSTLTIKDDVARGGFGKTVTQAPPSTGSQTLYYAPDKTGVSGAGGPNDGWVVAPRAGKLWIHEVSTKGPGPANATFTVRHKESNQTIGVTLKSGGGAVKGSGAVLNLAKGDSYRVEVTIPAASNQGLRLKELAWAVRLSPAVGQTGWVLDGWAHPAWPAIWNGGAEVRQRPGVPAGLTYDQLVTVTTSIKGANVSPGIMQTMISTALPVVEWLRAVQPDLFTRLKIPLPSTDAGILLRDGWLLEPANSILLGAAYVRMQHNGFNFLWQRATKAQKRIMRVGTTRMDLPGVLAAYNTNRLRPNTAGLAAAWALPGVQDRVEASAPAYNAALDLFDDTAQPLTPAPTVRFQR
jgi:hypothetical protein